MPCEVGAGGAAAASTFTLAAELAVWLRSSVTVPVTVTVAGAAICAVFSSAVLSRGVTLPAVVANEIEMGWLSGLAAWQVMVELSPWCTDSGDAAQLMLGVVGAGGAGGGGGGGGSKASTPSPTFTSSSAKVTMAVALLGCTPITIISPSERRGSSLSLFLGNVTVLACVSSVVVALNARLSTESCPICS